MTTNFETDSPCSPLTPLQSKVATALAHGSSITAAAETFGLHRVTIHRWLKNHGDFYAAVQQGHAEYALALRDDLRELSERALRTLSSVLDDPTTPPSVLVKTAIFILQRPQFPKQGWSLPVDILEPTESAMDPDSPLIAVDEQRLLDLEAAKNTEPPAPAAPEPPAADATQCNTMQHISEISTPAAEPALVDDPLAPVQHNATQCNMFREFPVPAARPKAVSSATRHAAEYTEVDRESEDDLLNSLLQASSPKTPGV